MSKKCFKLNGAITFEYDFTRNFFPIFQNWEKQEDDFHLHQARLRSSIRIKNGRAKPIDLLAVYINPEEENLEIQMHEPYAALVVSISFHCYSMFFSVILKEKRTKILKQLPHVY